MRIYKFRGQRTDTKEFVYGLPVEYCGEVYILVLTNFQENRVYESYPEKEMLSYKVIRESVGQYTGIKDRNEIEIYEGDIIKEKYIKPPLSIKYDEEECGFVATSINTNINYGIQLGSKGKYEVIGNIYDNPELIK